VGREWDIPLQGEKSEAKQLFFKSVSLVALRLNHGKKQGIFHLNST